MKKIAPDLDVFLDALSLRSGELWESRLAEEVISKDIFYNTTKILLIPPWQRL